MLASMTTIGLISVSNQMNLSLALMILSQLKLQQINHTLVYSFKKSRCFVGATMFVIGAISKALCYLLQIDGQRSFLNKNAAALS